VSNKPEPETVVRRQILRAAIELEITHLTDEQLAEFFELFTTGGSGSSVADIKDASLNVAYDHARRNVRRNR